MSFRQESRRHPQGIAKIAKPVGWAILAAGGASLCALAATWAVTTGSIIAVTLCLSSLCATFAIVRQATPALRRFFRGHVGYIITHDNVVTYNHEGDRLEVPLRAIQSIENADGGVFVRAEAPYQGPLYRHLLSLFDDDHSDLDPEDFVRIVAPRLPRS